MRENLTTMNSIFVSTIWSSQTKCWQNVFVKKEMTFSLNRDDFILSEVACQITHSKLFGFPHITILLSTNFEPQKKILTWNVGYQTFLASFIIIRYKEFELLSKFWQPQFKSAKTCKFCKVNEDFECTIRITFSRLIQTTSKCG